MERYKKEGKGSQEMEDYLKTMLDNEVKPIWPKGWMQSRYVTLVQNHKNLIIICLKVFLYLIVYADVLCLHMCRCRVLMKESRSILNLFPSLP